MTVQAPATVLAELLSTYRAKAANASQTAAAATSPATPAATDSASFSQEALQALEAEQGTTGLSSLLDGGTSGTDTTDPLAALLGETSSAAPTTTAAQALLQAEQSMTTHMNDMFGNGSTDASASPSSSSDGLSSMLASYGQSIVSQDDLIVQQALARASGSSSGASPSPSPATAAEQMFLQNDQTATQKMTDLFGNSSTDASASPSSSSDGLSSMLASYGQSIVSQDDLIVQQALARASASSGPASPGSNPATA